MNTMLVTDHSTPRSSTHVGRSLKRRFSILCPVGFLLVTGIAHADPDCLIVESLGGGNLRFQTSSDPSLQGVVTGGQHRPGFEVWWGDGTHYVLQLKKIYETLDGETVDGSVLSLAGLPWNISFPAEECDPFTIEWESMGDLENGDAFSDFIFDSSMYLDPDSLAPMFNFSLELGPYAWVSNSDQLNLEFSFRGEPGVKPTLEPDGYTVTLGSASFSFDSRATVRPGGRRIGVFVEVEDYTVRLTYNFFGGTVFHNQLED